MSEASTAPERRRCDPDYSVGAQADGPIGPSLRLSQYLRKHNFGLTWAKAEIKAGRLKAVRRGAHYHITSRAEADHLGLLEAEAAERRRQTA